MRRFDPAHAATVVELQQLLFDFGYEIDANQGRAITDYYAEDGVFELGAERLAGHAAIRDFYVRQRNRVAGASGDGRRQVLHAFVNVRVTVNDHVNATLDFFNLNFSATGERPVTGAIAPNLLVECRMTCRREADGRWRIVRFGGTPQFVNAEPFLAALVRE